MPSRTPYTDILHTNGVLITKHPLPEGDEHPFDRPVSLGSLDDDIDELENEVAERESREVLMPVEEIDNVLYLNEDDVADGDESQEWQVSQTARGINA